MQWGQEERGTLYYTPSEKAKQKGRPLGLFESLVPDITIPTNLSYSSLPMPLYALTETPQVGLEPTTLRLTAEPSIIH